MKRILTFSLLFILVFSIRAQLNTPLPIDPNVRYGKLENGLTYYIRHNAYPEKRAEFYIAQKVGSMQEEDDQLGLAHFLEHMAFNGSKNFPGRKTMMDYLEKSGAKFGVNVNAYTSFDETVYNLSKIPVTRPGIVDSCLLILHDWSSFITLENEEIDKERAIIKEEWRTRGDANWRILEKVLPALFEGSKYANRMPIGTMEVVENFDYQTLKDYYHKWYRPDLQAIIVVGDINVDDVEAKVKTMFADIPKPINPAERIYYNVPDNDKPIVAIATDPEATTTRVSLFIKHDVVPLDVKQTQMGLLASIVKNMASSMLSARLSEIAQKADAPFAAAYAYDGNFFVAKTKDAWTTMAISKDGKIKETLAVLARENERVKKYGFTEAEVERAKANMLKNYEDAYNNRNKQQNSIYVNEYVESFVDGEGIPGIEYEYNLFKQISPMLSAEMLNSVIQQLFSDKNIAITVLGPEGNDIKYPTTDELVQAFDKAIAENITPYEEKVSNEPLISKLPEAGKIVGTTNDTKLNTTTWTLSNGMKVVLKKTDYKDDEIIMSSIGFGGISLASDVDIQNANMAGYVPYIGGIGNFSATDLKKVLAGKSAKVNANISRRSQGLHGASSIKDIETLLQLTYLHFTEPRKDVEAYTSLMDMIKNQLKNATADPAFTFNDSVNIAMYKDNPRTVQLKYEDMDKLNYDQIINIYKEAFANPGSFTFTFVGTIDENTLKPLVEQYLASLPSGNKDATYKDVNYDIRKGQYVNKFEQEMKTPKTSVFCLYNGTLKRDLKTIIAMDALEQILDIVYVKTVREDEGGTYGVSVNASIDRIPAGESSLTITYDTDPEKEARISPIIHRELNNIAENGPSEVDFQKVKEYMGKKFQEDIKTNGYWSRTVLTNAFYNEDNYSSYQNTLNSLTSKDVLNLAKMLLSQGNMIEVIMNPKK